jgi:eukaryotic-like serine/threonine-protein kinase
VLPPGFRDGLADRYRIQRELGRGGMATVYLAEDVKHHRPVAIKLLSPELASVLGHDRFLREIEIAAQLTHPHILPLHDSGTSAGLLYYVMPYIEGETLRARIAREKQLPLDEAVEITRKVANALAHAHSRGVIHRDIKPENILLADGEPIVADFGIARAVTAAGGQHLTETGMALGTASYMSPEQALGESDLDARTDIYSLGCVLYEMLAGHPPYTGVSAQAIVARRLSEPVPALRTVRELVPHTVQLAVEKALARMPADRYSTAQAFAAALTAPVAERTVRTPVRDVRAETVPVRTGRARRALYAGVILLIALLALVFWFRRPSASASLDADLIAVAPFDVRGAELASWGEGMVDYLSRSLDGAGSLRTVSPSTFLHRWSGRADPASAEALGRRTGSGLVVFGSVIKGGGDSLRLRATMLDVAGGTAIGEVEVQGDTLGIDRLADSLAVGLLTQLGRTRPVGAVRDAPLGGVSLSAIKEFLRGEQMYRRRNWDSSLVHYAKAVALDTTFALAYRRLALVLSWSPLSSTSFESPGAYTARAAAFNRGLPLRDSLLIEVLWLGDRIDHEPDSLFSLTKRELATLHEAVRRFPGDPEVWMALGEVQMHGYLSKGLIPPSDVLASFDRAIALDSGFAPSFEHVFELAFHVGNVDRARAYAKAYVRIGSHDANSPELLLVAALLDSAGAESQAAASMVERANTLTLFRTGLEHLGGWADSSESAITLLRSLATGRHAASGPEWVYDSLMWPKYLARALLSRGHLREAREVYGSLLAIPDIHAAWFGFLDPAFDFGVLGVMSPDTVTAIMERNRRLFPTKALAWAYFQRDTLFLLRLAAEAAADAMSATDARTAARAQYQKGAADAYLTLIRGDSAAGLRALQAMPDSLCLVLAFNTCFFHKLTQARLLVARGDDRGAAAILDRDRWSYAPFHVLATLERARIAERLRERNLAVESYQRVVDLWRRADPELQPYVREAQDGLARLTGEP